MEPTYKLFYLRSLAAYGVEPWTVGDIVLRRWWQVWRQMLWRPYGEMHVSDAIINATRKPARSLMEGQWHGREVDGRIYEPTPAMQRLRSEQSIEVLKDNIGACSILRAVAIKPE